MVFVSCMVHIMGTADRTGRVRRCHRFTGGTPESQPRIDDNAPRRRRRCLLFQAGAAPTGTTLTFSVDPRRMPTLCARLSEHEWNLSPRGDGRFNTRADVYGFAHHGFPATWFPATLLASRRFTSWTRLSEHEGSPPVSDLSQ